MVRSVSNLNLGNVNGPLLNSSRCVARKGISKNVTKHIELPAKIALGSMGIYGTNQVIGDQKTDKSFAMKCSDYDSSDCHSDYWCGLAYP